MFTRAKVETSEVLALAPLSVLPEYQKNGVGRSMMRDAEWTQKALVEVLKMNIF